jgi:hypothetical protein
LCHVTATLSPRCSPAAATLEPRCASLCIGAVTLKPRFASPVPRCDQCAASWLAKLLLMPQSHCHVLTTTFSYVVKRGTTWLQRVQTWNNVAETGQSMTKRELEI